MKCKISRKFLHTIISCLLLLIIFSFLYVFFPKTFASRQVVTLQISDRALPGNPVFIGVHVKNRLNKLPIHAHCQLFMYSLDGKLKVSSSGSTNTIGFSLFKERIPANIMDGMYVKVVVTSPLGEEIVRAKLRINSQQNQSEILHLMTTKNMFQPGQDIPFRVLCLGSLNFEPKPGKWLNISLVNALGRLIFQGRYESDNDGVCHGHFSTSQDFLTGKYTLCAKYKDCLAKIPITIQLYDTKKIKIIINNMPSYITSYRDFIGKIQCRYMFGQIANNIDLELCFYNVDNEKYIIQGQSDADGFFSFTIPKEKIGLKNTIKKCKFVFHLKKYNETETVNLPYYHRERFVEILTENGTILPNQKNNAVLVAYYPNGQPAPGDYWLSPLQKIEIPPSGFAAFSFIPSAKETLFNVAWKIEGNTQTQKIIFGDYQKNIMGLRLERERASPKIFLQIAKYLRPDKAVLSVYQGNQEYNLDITSHLHKRETSVVLPPKFTSGYLSFALQLYCGHKKLFAMNHLFWKKPDKSSLQITLPQKNYKPKDIVEAQFHWQNKQGKKESGNITVAIVDEGVLSKSSSSVMSLSHRDETELLFEKIEQCAFFPARYTGNCQKEIENQVSLALQDKILRQNYIVLWINIVLFLFCTTIIMLLFNKSYGGYIICAIIVIAIMVINIPAFLRANRIAVPLVKMIQQPPRIVSPILNAIPPLANELRQYFPETLLFVPKLPLDKDGFARISFSLPDTMTSWRVTAVGNGESGAINTQVAHIKVSKELFCINEFPPALVKEDRVMVKWHIYNNSSTIQNCQFKLKQDKWFTTSNYLFQVTIPPNENRSVSLPIKAIEVGKHFLSVSIISNDYSDYLQSQITVSHLGKEWQSHRNLSLYPGNVAVSSVAPNDSFGRKQYAVFTCSPEAKIIQGLESMLHLPNGCFEQTSSTNYPNILIYKYLKKTDQLNVEKSTDICHMLTQGYQRLKSFEVKGGGFSLYGEKPASLWLSAYGLHQFHEMKDVVFVDPKLIQRTSNFILEHINRYDLTQKIYACLILREVGINVDFPKNITNFYEKAIWLNDFTLSPIAKKQAEELAKEFLQKKYSFRALSGASGKYAQIELACWILLALQKNNGDSVLKNTLFKYILKRRSFYGGWGTTATTIMALKVLLYEEQRASGHIVIESKKYPLVLDRPMILEVTNVEEFTFEGKGKIDCTLVEKAYRSWNRNEKTLMRRGLNIKTSINKETYLNEKCIYTFLCSNNNKIDAANCILHIPLMHKIKPLVSYLKQSLKQKKIQRYELDEKELILYIEKIDALQQISFSVPVIPNQMGKFTLNPASFYEYYNPVNLAKSSPKLIAVLGEKK